jgi:hypothetical protein
MLRTLQFFSLVSIVAILGCTSKRTILFEEENDVVFVGGERREVRSFGEKWVVYYFPKETAISMRTKILSSSFFTAGGWSELRISKESAFWGARQGAPKGTLSTISIVEGKLGSDLTAIEGSVGCSVVLTPTTS